MYTSRSRDGEEGFVVEWEMGGRNLSLEEEAASRLAS